MIYHSFSSFRDVKEYPKRNKEIVDSTLRHRCIIQTDVPGQCVMTAVCVYLGELSTLAAVNALICLRRCRGEPGTQPATRPARLAMLSLNTPPLRNPSTLSCKANFPPPLTRHMAHYAKHDVIHKTGST